MSEISIVGNSTPYGTGVQQTDGSQDAQGVSGQTAEKTDGTSQVLGGNGVTVTEGAAGDGKVRVSVTIEVPVLDTAEPRASLGVGLERLLSILQFELQEKQSLLAQKRLEAKQGAIEAAHANQVGMLGGLLAGVASEAKHAAQLSALTSIAVATIEGDLPRSALRDAVCIVCETSDISSYKLRREMNNLVGMLVDAGMDREMAHKIRSAVRSACFGSFLFGFGPRSLDRSINHLAKTIARSALGVKEHFGIPNFKQEAKVDQLATIIAMMIKNSSEEMEAMTAVMMASMAAVASLVGAQLDVSDALTRGFGTMA